MIEVKRHEYPERTKRDGTIIPAHYECCYYNEGKRQIAYYRSKDDTLYLNTDCIGNDWKKTEYERALNCSLKEDYKYLFDMLGADKTTKMSEFFDL